MNTTANQERVMDTDKAISRLFDKWGLAQEQRSMLLPQGEANTVECAEYLLSIHAYLRLLYPRNEELLYGWIIMREVAFDNQIPLEIMIRDGVEGIREVLRHLKNQTQR
ncbi:hypothetical protein [Candidatus Sororendozoicomonas aggregata]|uniref:hypothetical protein n=1 Tax=Candidatus Sororendozoicomonas aggregata TaxID=3073239 RepID=UPI002ED360D6